MADITMCATEDCPLADMCYRKTAKPSQYQSWSCFDKLLNRELNKCEMYYKNNNKNTGSKSDERIDNCRT
jgi:hypothetical protein